MKKKQITYAELKEALDYDSDTGVFIWNPNTSSKRVAGAIAGTVNERGYRVIIIKTKRHKAHRLAWLYVYGYCPENGLDHINRIKTDNRIVNLREVSQSCNVRNTGLLCTNTSGIKGVSFRNDTQKWRAEIIVEKKYIDLGCYTNKSDAAKARWESEKAHNFPNCCTDSSAYLYLKEHNE